MSELEQEDNELKLRTKEYINEILALSIAMYYERYPHEKPSKVEAVEKKEISKEVISQGQPEKSFSQEKNEKVENVEAQIVEEESEKFELTYKKLGNLQNEEEEKEISSANNTNNQYNESNKTISNMFIMDILGKQKEQKVYVSEYHIPTEVQQEIIIKEPIKEIKNKEPVKEISKKESIKETSKKEPVKEIKNKESVKEISKKESVKEISKKESIKEIQKNHPEKIENKSTPSEQPTKTITPKINKAEPVDNKEKQKIENKIVVSKNAPSEKLKISENSVVEKREDTVEDEEIKNYITSLENNKVTQAQVKEDKSKKDYDKDDLKKLEDSINDDANNNYDVNFDDYFGNEIAKEKESEKNNNQEIIIQSSVIKQIPSNDVKVKYEKIDAKKKQSLETSQNKPLAKNQVLYNNTKKEDLMQSSSQTQSTAGNKLVMKKINIIANEKSMSRTQDFKDKLDLNTPKFSPMKSKISFYSLKTKDQPNPMSLKEESISPYSKFNKTGYLYLKENKRSQEKNLKLKLLNKNPSNLQESSKNQVDELKKKQLESMIRNKTARTSYSTTKYNSDPSKPRLFSTGKINKKYEEQKKNFLNLMQDPRNPYSTYWSTRILERQYNVGIAVSGYCNGVPLIKLVKKKESHLPYISKKPNESEPIGEDMEFNTNKKNFFKARKDILEENEVRESCDNSGEIEYPVIYNYLK